MFWFKKKKSLNNHHKRRKNRQRNENSFSIQLMEVPRCRSKKTKQKKKTSRNEKTTGCRRENRLKYRLLRYGPQVDLFYTVEESIVSIFHPKYVFTCVHTQKDTLDKQAVLIVTSNKRKILANKVKKRYPFKLEMMRAIAFVVSSFATAETVYEISKMKNKKKT